MTLDEQKPGQSAEILTVGGNGANQHVGNSPGVTVDRFQIKKRFLHFLQESFS